MNGPILLVLLGALLVTQTLWGQMYERLGLKAAIGAG